MQDITNTIASVHLGKKSEVSEYYNPSLLVAVPREANRKNYNLEKKNLPFKGFDVWHAYEFSTLTNNGIPVTKLLKLKYSCENDYLVESKSLKLYLNSFNMARFGSSILECLSICKSLIEKDLSKILQTEVQLEFLDNNTQTSKIFDNYHNIMNYVDEKNLIISKFNEAPELLKTEDLQTKQSYFLTYESLRSNCRVTHQPDFGDVYISYTSKKHIKEESLIKYLTSFRSEYHFHEECCEMIFKRLIDILDRNDELLVCALYTRRGGIDICPIRCTHSYNNNDISKLLDLHSFARGSIKQ